MPAANGLLYTAAAQSVPAPNNTAFNIWEMQATAVSVLIHSITVEFIPRFIGGVPFDNRANLSINVLTYLGYGGTSIIPTAEHPRNTISALSTFNAVVISPGVLAGIKSASRPTTIIPYDRQFTPDQRMLIVPGGKIAIALATSLDGQVLYEPYVLSSQITFEEF